MNMKWLKRGSSLDELVSDVKDDHGGRAGLQSLHPIL